MADIEVIATSKVTDLVQNKEQVFSLNKGDSKYFRIDITDYNQIIEGISISIQKLFGNFEFYYTIYKDDEFIYPHRDNSKVEYYFDADNSVITISREKIDQSIKQNMINLDSKSKLYLIMNFNQEQKSGFYKMTYKRD